MERVNRILENDSYIELIRKIEYLENDRIYCHHDMAHFLDVARIARILSFEENILSPVSLIYATALLHDIGRARQYADGTPHEEESARLAPEILSMAGYDREEIQTITEAISLHGMESSADRKDLTGIIYRADKLSRKCFSCKAYDTCHKRADKRNDYIKV